MQTCQAETTSGSPCKAKAMSGSQYCYFHNPDVSEEERRKSNAKGGENRRIVNESPLPPIKLENPNEVVLLLSDTINRVRSGELDIRTANCIGYLSGHLTRVLEFTEVYQRLKRIEDSLGR